MPRVPIYLMLLLAALTLIPLGLIYRAQHSSKDQPRIQVVYDMDDQFSYKAQQENPFFADGLAMRKTPEGTVARGRLAADDTYFRGRVEGDTLFTETIPLEVDQAMMERGQERYQIHCAPCHGITGDGNGLVNLRAQQLAEGTWTPPTDLASETVVGRPDGHIFNTIGAGIRNMPGYAAQIPVADRWAIVAYVRALQLSRNAKLDDVPAAERATLAQ